MLFLLVSHTFFFHNHAIWIYPILSPILLLLCAPALLPYYYFLLTSPDLTTSYFLPRYNLETSFNTYKCTSS